MRRRQDEGRNYRPAFLLLHGSGNTPAGQVWTCPSPSRTQPRVSPVSQVQSCLPARWPGSPLSLSAVPRLPQTWNFLPMDGPNRMVRHTLQPPHPGQDAGRQGRKRRHLVRPWLFPASSVAGRGASWGVLVPVVLLVCSSPGCGADRHGSGGRLGLGGSQPGGMHGAQSGGPALSPTLGPPSRWAAAAQLLRGSRQDPPSAPNLARNPSPFAPILPSSAPGRGHRGGDKRREAQPRAPRLCAPRRGRVPSRAVLIPHCAPAQGHPLPGLGTLPVLQDSGHQGGF